MAARRRGLGRAAALVLAAGTACGGSVHVAPVGRSKPEIPYDTWARAANDIQTAVRYAQDRYPACNAVLVSNGTYEITTQITISTAITVRSYGNGVYGWLGNASNTIVQRSSGETRIFSMTDGNAVIAGLTIRNGNSPNDYTMPGSGVYMTGGLVRDCIIRDNGNGDRVRGAGVYMTGGTVSNCVVRNNACQHDGEGGGIRASGGSKILYCRILDNRGGKDGDGGGFGGGIYMDSGSTVLVRNCLIARNYMGSVNNANHGAGVYMNSGRIESCTIVANVLRRTDGGGLGGGVYRVNGTVQNSIICFNKDAAENGATDNYHGLGAADTASSCTTPDIGGDNIADDPLLVDPAGGDFRPRCDLPVMSPCINAGRNADWMEKATDLVGNPRILQGVVDMGAFEYRPLAPLIGSVGVSNVTATAVVWCRMESVGAAEAALFVSHGPSDGGTNRRAWASEVRFPGRQNAAGAYNAAVPLPGSNSMWFYRCRATNSYGEAWADSTGSLLTGVVDLRASRRETTEKRPAAFVFTRPATATNGQLTVRFALSGGVNGRDYDWLDDWATIPDGSAEVSVPLIPSFPFGDTRPKVVTVTLVPDAYRVGANSNASIATRAP